MVYTQDGEYIEEVNTAEGPYASDSALGGGENEATGSTSPSITSDPDGGTDDDLSGGGGPNYIRFNPMVDDATLAQTTQQDESREFEEQETENATEPTPAERTVDATGADDVVGDLQSTVENATSGDGGGGILGQTSGLLSRVIILIGIIASLPVIVQVSSLLADILGGINTDDA